MNLNNIKIKILHGSAATYHTVLNGKGVIPSRTPLLSECEANSVEPEYLYSQLFSSVHLSAVLETVNLASKELKVLVFFGPWHT